MKFHAGFDIIYKYVYNSIYRKDIIMWLKKLYGTVAGSLLRFYIWLFYRPRLNFLGGDLPHEPVIFASNHTGLLDGLIIVTGMWRMGRPVTLMAKEWFDIPLLKPIFEYSRCIPVKRTGVDTSWLRMSISSIKDGGHNFLIFPEGHTSRSGEIDTFQNGVLFLASKTGSQIVPIWHNPARIFFGTEIRVGEPMSLPDGFSVRTGDPETICNDLRDAVISLAPKKESSKGFGHFNKRKAIVFFVLAILLVARFAGMFS